MRRRKWGVNKGSDPREGGRGGGEEKVGVRGDLRKGRASEE